MNDVVMKYMPDPQLNQEDSGLAIGTAERQAAADQNMAPWGNRELGQPRLLWGDHFKPAAKFGARAI